MLDQEELRVAEYGPAKCRRLNLVLVKVNYKAG